MSEPVRGSVTGLRKVVLVTGARGGVGTAIAADLAEDFDVLALGRDATRLAAPGRIPGVRPLAWDLLDDGRIESLLEGLPRLDVLIHAAAIAKRRSVEAASVDDWREHLELNVVAPAELARAALPALRAARGQVPFINSGAGFGA